MLTVEFPHTAVLYLRYAKRSEPQGYRYVIKTPGGTVEYDVLVLKTQKYTIDDIFEKNLLIAQRLAEIGNDLVEKALKLQKS